MAHVEIQRYIDGANVNFAAGCVLNSLTLNPSVRVTDKFSVKADANSLLLYRRRYTVEECELKDTLKQVGGPLKFFSKANSFPRRDDHWSNVVGFYQPDHTHTALRYFSGVPQMDATLLYTVYFTAPTEVSEAVYLSAVHAMNRNGEESMGLVRMEISWRDARNGVRTLRIASTKQEAVVRLKLVLETIFSGTVAKSEQGSSHELWHEFFRAPEGDVYLQHISRRYGALTVSDKNQCRLRIYSPKAGDAYYMVDLVEMRLAEKMDELTSLGEAHVVKLDRESMKRLISSGAVARAQKQPNVTVNLDIIAKKLIFHCSQERVPRVVDLLGLAKQNTANSTSLRYCSTCGDVTTDIDFSCGHVSCQPCFEQQLEVARTDLSSRHFPVCCWENNCKQPISIHDLRKHTSGPALDSVLRSSLRYYIRSRPDVYRNCRKADCESAYFRNGSDEIFTCPTCLTQTCTRCHEEPHVGWTCAAYQVRIQEDKENERLLEGYKATAGTKECPKCNTMIEKTDGCNHIECSGCHFHLCWACLKAFEHSGSCYDHMATEHEGDELDEFAENLREVERD